MAPEAMEPEAPKAQLYSAEKQAIMEAMNLIQQGLDILMEVCPPEGYIEDEPEGEVPLEEPPVEPEQA